MATRTCYMPLETHEMPAGCDARCERTFGVLLSHEAHERQALIYISKRSIGQDKARGRPSCLSPPRWHRVDHCQRPRVLYRLE